mgnify:CR=1 FL=1
MSVTPPPVEGTWVITDANFASVSAMSHADAKKWFGKSYQYFTNIAKLDQQECRSPSYDSQSLDEQAFESQFNTSLAQAGINQKRFEAITVSCESGMSGPGQSIFKLNDSNAVTVWDGVFFKLEKASEPANVSY